jgi:predicted metal-dependent peptidase
MDTEKRLSKAKTALILEHPFVGNIALNMPFELTEDIPTAATNGEKVMFNPDFCNELSDEELKFLVAHECMHPMLEHPFRRQERDIRVWNQAGDYVINQLLVDENMGKMPEGGLYDIDVWNKGGGTTDGIYKILPKEGASDDSNNGIGSVGKGGVDPLDQCLDAEGSPAENEQKASEWKVKVAQAAQAAKMMGKMSAGLERFVGKVLEAKVDWREVLQRFVEKCKDDTRSWARPNRRFLAQGLYLPTSSGEAMGELVVAVDCSGSIDEDTLNQFAAEVLTIKEDSNPSCIHVVYFDSEVCHYEKFTRDDELHIEPHGGGGTAFSPVFDYLNKYGIDPIACVFLTDLYCDDYGDEPSFPVLWVATDKDKTDAPFGEVVVMDD